MLPFINSLPSIPNYLNRKSQFSQLENTNHRNIQQVGTLTRGNITTPFTIKFRVLPTGKPYLLCIGTAMPFSHSVSVGTKHGYSRFKKYSIKSNTSGRYSLQAFPVHIFSQGFSSSGQSHLSVSPSVVKIKDNSKRAKPPYKLVFALANFHFMGLDFSQSIRSKRIYHNRDRFSIQLGTRTFTFIQDPRIESIKKVQIETHLPRITSWVEHNINSFKDITLALETVDNVCDMLIIVSNQNINWAFWRLYDKSGRLVREEYHDRHLGEYKHNTNEVIDNFRIFGGLQHYLESCYDQFAQLKVTYNLQKFKGFMNSAPPISSVETLLLHLIPGVELIANMILKYSTIPRLNLSVNQLRGMNIEAKLNRLYNHYYKYFTANKWNLIRTGIVRQIRNPLFHSGLISVPINISFSKTRYLHLIALQLYLKLVGYNGKYIDFTYNYRRNQRIRTMK